MAINNYNTEKIIDSLKEKGHTSFLTELELTAVKGRLNHNEYKIYKPYVDANKVILYKKAIPNITLLKINTNVLLRHQDILGTIFSLGIKEDTFGDIVKYKDEFYIFTLPHLKDYLIYNIKSIKNNKVTLTEANKYLTNYFHQEYKREEYIVSSLRIDNVVSTIISDSRSNTLLKFKEKEVLLNNLEAKPTRELKPNDTFSIRKYGKYKYIGPIKTTKKGGYIIEVAKFI